jgi:3-oxoacyl-[acyl-carrier protein] reductase
VSQLADEGVNVAFCARSRDHVAALAHDLDGRSGAKVRGYVADMGDAAQVSKFLEAAEADLGSFDILVNNVGHSPSRNFLHMTDADWSELFELNLMSAVRCTRHVLPGMRRQRFGRIIMISTGAAKYPNAPLIDYSASKAAMVAVAKALASKYGSDNILTNSVLPGLIDTPMWDRAAGEIGAATKQPPEAIKAGMAKSVPTGRYGTADEVASVVVFLCSERASYVNGIALSIDGGQGSSIF